MNSTYFVKYLQNIIVTYMYLKIYIINYLYYKYKFNILYQIDKIKFVQIIILNIN